MTWRKKVRAVLSARCIDAVSRNKVLYCDRKVRAVLGAMYSYKDSQVISYCHREGSQRARSELYWVGYKLRQSSNILLSQEGKSEREVTAAAGV